MTFTCGRLFTVYLFCRKNIPVNSKFEPFVLLQWKIETVSSVVMNDQTHGETNEEGSLKVLIAICRTNK